MCGIAEERAWIKLTQEDGTIMLCVRDDGVQMRKEIASTLHISERTLSNHLQHIFEKLGVTSSVEAVTKAIQMGYLPPIC